ncbi:glycosyltransferase [Cytobacillus kochii]|uniref:glycosyltransferase n=1 Tax=Cytobacillus kochii TaxID=859143 RepID=UPI0020413CF6|nr:glycosyltransferase [Cytobacillus kochii]MCM3321511.1 glycosyltransferase [Cytobacillus kochii]MCM3343655.1 glycosyltransferase [Cytobacillus kochii]
MIFTSKSHQLTILQYGFDIDDFLLRAAKPANHIRKRKKRQQLLIYTGRLIKAKGVQYLITALSYVKEQNNNWGCWIIGDGEVKQHLQKRTNDYHLRNQILFLGERNDVPSLLQQADLFILPTLSENQPLSIIEAQLSGLAIIASDVGGIPEMIEDGVTGFLTPIGDSKKLAEKIAFLLHEEKVRKSIGISAFEFATHHWSLANAIKQVLCLYHQAIQKKLQKNDQSGLFR